MYVYVHAFTFFFCVDVLTRFEVGVLGLFTLCVVSGSELDVESEDHFMKFSFIGKSHGK